MMMSRDREVLEKVLTRGLYGMDAHVPATNALEDLHWKDASAQPEGVPYTILQLLSHMTYWQDWTVKWLDGENPPLPKHASESWPESTHPKNQKDLKKAIEAFMNGLEELKQRIQDGDFFSEFEKRSRLEMLHSVVLHNSYHLGQIVFIRRLLGAWPPPSGGNTW
jgi:uncharacterized damage-inducible protein DinB